MAATLQERGYENIECITKTLQGDICSANCTKKDSPQYGQTVVIKRTCKTLHEQRCTLYNGEKFAVQEDIVQEATFMNILCKFKPPASMTQAYDFFEDDVNYYLVMEHGGSCFLEFVLKCHEMIRKGELSIREWRKQCKFMFSQMIQFLNFMHSKGFTHLDISLENILIAQSCYFDEKTGKLHNCYIKFIDFGLSEFFPWNFKCNKFVGKTAYKSPEVYNREEYDARKSDIWMIGVVFLMTMTGIEPYPQPNMNNDNFKRLMEYGIISFLQSAGKAQYMTRNSADLIENILKYDPEQRLTLSQIMKHPYLRAYFFPITTPKANAQKHKHNRSRSETLTQKTQMNDRRKQALPALYQSHSNSPNLEIAFVDITSRLPVLLPDDSNHSV